MQKRTGKPRYGVNLPNASGQYLWRQQCNMAVTKPKPHARGVSVFQLENMRHLDAVLSYGSAAAIRAS